MTAIANPTTPTVPTFDSLYAKMLAQFRYYARRFSGCKTIDREDVVQDLMGIALEMYTSQVRRGRAVYYTPLVRYAIKRFRDGRRFTGQNTTDILSENTQMKGRSKVRLFSEYESKPGSWGFEHYNRQPGVAEGVQSKIDYEDWVAQQAERDQQIITDLSMGETTNNVAKKYRVSAGLISQYRKRYRKSWDDFMGDTHKPA